MSKKYDFRIWGKKGKVFEFSCLAPCMRDDEHYAVMNFPYDGDDDDILNKSFLVTVDNGVVVEGFLMSRVFTIYRLDSDGRGKVLH